MTGAEATVVAIGFTIGGLAIRELPKIILEKVLLMRRPKELAPTAGNGKRLELRSDVEKVFVDTLSRDILPVLNQQTTILSQIAVTNTAMKDGILILVDRTTRKRA